ncbi:MAG: arylamine N-acetyltransferase [Chloroflexota bacterium]
MMQSVLDHFGLTAPPTPNLTFARELLTAYTQNVPWGSTCRISRKSLSTPAERARFAHAFWADVIERGGDGTCFESNYAFFALLQSLGYAGYLTLNNMGDSVQCHSAIVLLMDDEKWLVDVGLPVLALIHLDPHHVTIGESVWHEYIAIPKGNGFSYDIMQSHHPSPYCFTLMDAPIEDEHYRQRLIHDHTPEAGLFLDKVIMRKVIDGSVVRYNGRDEDRIVEEFPPRAKKRQYEIEGDVAAGLSETFGVDVDVVQAALDASE